MRSTGVGGFRLEFLGSKGNSDWRYGIDNMKHASTPSLPSVCDVASNVLSVCRSRLPRALHLGLAGLDQTS